MDRPLFQMVHSDRGGGGEQYYISRYKKLESNDKSFHTKNDSEKNWVYRKSRFDIPWFKIYVIKKEIKIFKIDEKIIFYWFGVPRACHQNCLPLNYSK